MRVAALAVFLLNLAACVSRGPAAPSPGARAEVRALADAYLGAFFRRHPEEGTVLGWPGADHAAVTDERPEALAAWQREEDALLARARAVDPRSVAGTREAVPLAVVTEALESSRAVRVCRLELWPVSPDRGWQAEYAALAEVQPVASELDRAAARTRLALLPGRVDAQVENLREGVRLGYVATVENVDRVVAQLDRLLRTPPASWPEVRPAIRADDPAFRVELAGVVERALVPAVERLRTFLVQEYRTRARARPTLLALPQGERCYRAAVRRALSLDAEPAALHATGLARLRAAHGELSPALQRRFGAVPVADALRRLREDPAYRLATEDDVLAVMSAAGARAADAAPRAFARVPAGRVVVRPFPRFRGAAEPADRYLPDRSGDAPAGVAFVGADPARRDRARLEAAAFGLAAPGRHLQASLALERTGGPPVAAYVATPAFTEGWAAYAERLAAGMGLYSDDVYHLGALADQALAAARLVADSGVNVQGWPRQRAIDYLVANAGVSPERAAAEVDRCAASPGEGTAAALGALELGNLRAEAERALGAAFDLRAFHEVVLGEGAVPLPVLRERVRAWIAGGGTRV